MSRVKLNKQQRIEFCITIGLKPYNTHTSDTYFCVEGVNGGNTVLDVNTEDKDFYQVVFRHVHQMGRDSLKMELHRLTDITGHH